MPSIRIFAAGFALAAAVTAINVPAATADTVLMKYRCGNAVTGGWDYNWNITITAPATATRGQTVTLNVSAESTIPTTEPVEANLVFGFLDIRLGGASSGTVGSTRMSNPDIEAPTPLELTGGTAQATLANVGEVTYKAARFSYGITGAGLWCDPRPGFVPPVVTTTRVI